MGINKYDKPARVAFIDQYAPIPFEELAYMGKAKEDRFMKSEAAKDQLAKMLKVNALDNINVYGQDFPQQDRENANRIIEGINKELSDVASNYKSTSLQGLSRVNNLIRETEQNLNSGELAQYQNRYNTHGALMKTMADSKDLDPARLNLINEALYANRHGEGTLTEQGILDKVNVSKNINAYLKNMNVLGDAKAQAKAGYITQEGYTRISQERISAAVDALLKSGGQESSRLTAEAQNEARMMQTPDEYYEQVWREIRKRKVQEKKNEAIAIFEEENPYKKIKADTTAMKRESWARKDEKDIIETTPERSHQFSLAGTRYRDVDIEGITGTPNPSLLKAVLSLYDAPLLFADSYMDSLVTGKKGELEENINLFAKEMTPKAFEKTELYKSIEKKVLGDTKVQTLDPKQLAVLHTNVKKYVTDFYTRGKSMDINFPKTLEEEKKLNESLIGSGAFKAQWRLFKNPEEPANQKPLGIKSILEANPESKFDYKVSGSYGANNPYFPGGNVLTVRNKETGEFVRQYYMSGDRNKMKENSFEHEFYKVSKWNVGGDFNYKTTDLPGKIVTDDNPKGNSMYGKFKGSTIDYPGTEPGQHQIVFGDFDLYEKGNETPVTRLQIDKESAIQQNITPEKLMEILNNWDSLDQIQN